MERESVTHIVGSERKIERILATWHIPKELFNPLCAYYKDAIPDNERAEDWILGRLDCLFMDAIQSTRLEKL